MKEALIVFWDKEDDDAIDYDAQGLSCFDVVGMLQAALDLAESRLPSIRHQYEIEDE